MITENQAIEIIEAGFAEDLAFCAPKNFKISQRKPNTVQFTVNILSLDVLFSLMESEEVENVYFHPSVAPPRSHVDASASRYRIYVKFIAEIQV